jgi:sugar phosphate isomerase/epimerase
MKNLLASISFLTVMILLSASTATYSGKAEKAGWLLGAQSYTFHKFTFVETVDRMHKLGLKYVEVYYGQKLGEGFTGTMDYKMDAGTRQKVLDLAKSKGISIVASGVVVCENNAEWDQLFEFAKSMGIKTITSEPALNQLDYVEKLADQYNIDVAIHNHPKPSLYWNPDDLMKALKGRSRHLGSCADVGHWNRMGIDPVVALKKCEGRIKILHFKDVDKAGADAHDTIWGTGVCNVEAMLKELKRQNFKGLFSMEYEYNVENPDPDMKECITYFHQTADRIL